MWVMLNNSFLSIVDPEADYHGKGGPVGDKLLVRARLAGDIEAVFPGAAVKETPERDYRFRAMIDRGEVAEAMAQKVRGIHYSNFKGSVKDHARHDAYADVWGIMYRLQKWGARIRKSR